MNMIKNIYDCVKFGKRCDFIFKRISVSKVTGTCIYIVAHISKVFTTLWIAPIMKCRSATKTWCINHLIFHVSVFVLRGFIILLYFLIFLNVKVYVILCLTILWTIQLYIDIKWISKKLFIHIFVVLFFNIKWFSK